MGHSAFDDLHSNSGRGQIAKTSVYYIVHGWQRKRAYAVPADPQTEAQLTVRTHFAAGKTCWDAQDQNYRDTYNEKAKRVYVSMTGYNLFMRRWLKHEI